MSFATCINCMDGRVQLPGYHWCLDHFGVTYVDMITAAGPNGILARHIEEPDSRAPFLLERIRISVEKHGSIGVAVVGHYDCAGNPGQRAKQNADTRAACAFLRQSFEVPILGLWIDADWQVHLLDEA